MRERKNDIATQQDESGVDMNCDPDELTEEQLLAEFRISLKQALAGQTRPAEEVMREIRQMLAAEDDASNNN